MDAIVIGIDVSKDKLDVHVLPAAQAFTVARNGAGIEELAARLAALAPAVVALIATARKLLTILNAIIRDNRPWQNA